jgi:NADPH-dependent curcumin reductase CurA
LLSDAFNILLLHLYSIPIPFHSSSIPIPSPPATMSLPTQRRVWILANPPSGPIQPDTFRLDTSPLPAVGDGELLLQIEYLSNDPAQRGMIQAGADPKRAYRPPLTAGQPMTATAVATVLESRSAKYKVGERVTGRLGWSDYDVVHESKIDGPAAYVATPRWFMLTEANSPVSPTRPSRRWA